MFKRGWKGVGERGGWQTSRWMQNPEAIFHCPSYVVYRLQLPSHPFALRCASPIDSGPFTALAEPSTQTRYSPVNRHCSAFSSLFLLFLLSLLSLLPSFLPLVSSFSTFCVSTLRRRLLLPNQCPYHFYRFIESASN